MSCLWIYSQRDILYLTELVEQKVYRFFSPLLILFFVYESLSLPHLNTLEGWIKIYSWKDIWLNALDYDVELYYGYFICRKRWRFWWIQLFFFFSCWLLVCKRGWELLMDSVDFTIVNLLLYDYLLK